MAKRVIFGLVLAIAASASPAAVLAGAPTEISVYPGNQYLELCAYENWYSERAYWTVTLWGGTSGNFTWSVNYGDGHSSGAQYAAGPYAEFNRHHDYNCHNGEVTQNWYASRSGGGTAHYVTTVQTG